MKILAIESSADDTGIAILEAKKVKNGTEFTICANKVHTQIDIHTEYGGIFPMMAKREHGKNIIPTLHAALKESKLLQKNTSKKVDVVLEKKLEKILARENNLGSVAIEFLRTIKKPKIDAIAVTVGPGLEPALWVGISTARALSLAWDIPIIPVNHMEGHVLSPLVQKGKKFTYTQNTFEFPVLSLLVSGGHTELVLMKDWMKYNIIGSTRDDAVGEAFDKVARMLGLPYPGGPEISRLAHQEREKSESNFTRSGRTGSEDIRGPGKLLSDFSSVKLPRPMIHTKDYDFSFSGLKTAVLYFIRDNGPLTEKLISQIAKEFEDAVTEVLVTKTEKAVKNTGAKTVIVGGGVSANTFLKQALTEKIKTINKKIKLHFPTKTLSTDNALMIAIAGYFQYQKKKPTKNSKKLVAQGNLTL